MTNPDHSTRPATAPRTGRGTRVLALVAFLVTAASCFTYNLEEATHDIRAVYDRGEWSRLSIELESVSDQVMVQGVPGGVVEATLSASALVSDGSSDDIFAGLSLVFDNTTDKLRLTTRYTGTRAEQVVIDAVDITMPHVGALVVPSAPASLTIRDIAGPVDVYSSTSSVDVSGCLDVTITTRSGPISAQLTADATLITGSGSIVVDLVDAHRDTVYIETSSGAIEVHVSPLVSYTFELDVAAAPVDFDVGFDALVHDGSSHLYETLGVFGPRVVIVSSTGPVTVTDW